MPYYPTRKITIIAQDPGVRLPDPKTGKPAIVLAEVEIPNEGLSPGRADTAYSLSITTLQPARSTNPARVCPTAL